MASEVSIAPIQERDAAAIAALLQPIIAAGIYTAMTKPATPANQRGFIQSLHERAIYLGAWSAAPRLVLGIQEVLPTPDPSVGEIGTFVRLDAHRRGVGRALFRETCAAARHHGFTALRATIRRTNPVAPSFYASLGFVAQDGDDDPRVVVLKRRIV